jgi:hypothetical protein
MPRDTPAQIPVWLHEERASLLPYGAPDQRSVFTPEKIIIEKVDSTLIAERRSPKDSFAGHQMNTPWDPLHRAYFNGEALWTYLTTPFLLAMDGVHVDEVEPWREGAETWRVLRAYFPGSIETHSLVQDFFFGEDLMLRLQREHRGWFSCVAADFRLCGSKRHSSADQASCVYPRTGSPSDLGNADGID